MNQGSDDDLKPFQEGGLSGFMSEAQKADLRKAVSDAPWTPGPWGYGLVPAPGEDDGCKMFAVNGIGPEHWPYVCENVNGQANARLIAAAPEMAELLDVFMGSLVGPNYSLDRADAAAWEARALLARIRGEQE